MKQRTFPALILAGTVGLSLTACGGSDGGDAMPAGEAGMPAMPGMPAPNQSPAAAATHVADGTVNSIDMAAGMVNISHGPVASADWPAMTMSFKLADSGAARAVEPGQRVRFEFTIETGMSATVTKISAVQ
jgi:Cu(I)/Ag(I) efflux system membrane fusion protein